MCHGETTVISEDFFVGVLEEVWKSGNCWTKTGSKDQGRGTMMGGKKRRRKIKSLLTFDCKTIGKILIIR